MDWAVYEGQLATNPFKTVRVEAKGKPNHYEAMTDEEVLRLLALDDPRIGAALRVCLLSGMRAGEAVGLVRDDLVWKGNLGWFAWIRPNEVRTLKTDAAERFIPLHSALTPLLDGLPATGRLFPGLSVNMVTKRFAVLREQGGDYPAGGGVPLVPEVVRDPVRAGRGAGALHRVDRWPPVSTVREPDDLRHLLCRDQRRAEA